MDGGNIRPPGTQLRNSHGARICITHVTLWLGHESVETTQVYLHADLAL